jgi:hypothetical protein
VTNLAASAGDNNYLKMTELAQELAAELQADIQLSTHREEHVRVTARANKALELFNGLLANQ